MAALIFIIETLLSLCMLAVLLRLLLQWSRADFRNPLARSIVHLTNPGPPAWDTWLRLTAIEVIETVLKTYLFAIFLYALLSMIAPGVYSPAQSLLVSLCEPILRPIRRVIPPLGGLDLSPMWAGILIYALLILLRGSL